MSDFNVRSDSVNVEQIMEQIRARIRERGVDYRAADSRDGGAQLEKFLDPRESDPTSSPSSGASNPTPVSRSRTTRCSLNRALFLIWIRRLLRPVLKLFFNRTRSSTCCTRNRRSTTSIRAAPPHYELIHNLVVETTRLGIEVKNLRMRNRCTAGRLQ
jgi:hypothetical protein